MTDAAVLTALSADQRLVALTTDARPAFLWRAGANELLWTNAAGASLLGLSLIHI